MSSLYLRGQTWWAKSLENGRVVRWSLKTASRAEAKRRVKLYDSRPREEPLPSRLKGQTTWDVAASELLDYYQAFGTRRPHEAGRVLRTLGRFHTCLLKPGSPVIAVLRCLTLEPAHALLALRRSIGRTGHDGP